MVKAKQILKFALVFGVLMVLTWWVDKYDIRTYDDTATTYNHALKVTWLILTFFTVTGLIHVILYSIVTTRAMFRALSLSSVLCMTAITAGVFSATIYGWDIPDSIPQAVWMVYYPAISLATVLIRYLCLKAKI